MSSQTRQRLTVGPRVSRSNNALSDLELATSAVELTHDAPWT